MKLVDRWYSLDLLPLYLSLSKDKLQTTIQQLQSLEQQEIPTENIVKRIIKLYEAQSKNIWVVIEQCNKWRRQKPDQNQIISLIQLKKNTKHLEEINQQILCLAKAMRDKNDINFKYEVKLVLDSMLITHDWE